MSLDQIYLLPLAQQEAILNGPALAPPPGVISNLDDPSNGNAAGLAASILLLSLATITVLLATYTKLFFVKKIYLEDYLAFAGYGIYVAKESCFYELIGSVGIFVHQWDIRVKDLSTIFWYYHIASDFYVVSILLLKVAILREWMRIFIQRGTRNTFFWSCHALLWANIVFYVITLIVGNVGCYPYAKLWDKTLPGHCKDNGNIDLATAPVGFVSDLLILLLPHRIIWRLHLSARKKIGLALIFMIGITACAASAYRIYASEHFLKETDRVYTMGGVWLGTAAEQVCAILVFFIPILPKAFKDREGPFAFLRSLASRLGVSTTKSETGSSQRRKEKSLFSSQASSEDPQHNEHAASGIPIAYRSFEAPQQHLHQTNLPHGAILQTTHIDVTEEHGYGITMPTPTHFDSARYYSQHKSQGSLRIYN
ncbi:hypothetical protein F5Y19DRAFT_469171 [Xylariaceae sp. FL1651]|nr:hypothetical protein F5Y19DRAFT_469171 [Xylariaceae sp. FL1651]